MDMEFIETLGHTIESKTVIVERLSKGGYVILGTPNLTMAELNELLGVIFHELNIRGR